MKGRFMGQRSMNMTEGRPRDVASLSKAISNPILAKPQIMKAPHVPWSGYTRVEAFPCQKIERDIF